MVWPNLGFLYGFLIWARYARLLFDSVQYCAYFLLDPVQTNPSGPIPLPSDFTVICVTLGDQHDYAINVQSWLASNPAAVVVVTNHDMFQQVQALMDSLADPRIHVHSVPEPKWRPKGCEGIRRTKTPYLIFVDDDVIWGRKTLEHIAYAFANPDVGGVNTMQEVHPTGLQLTSWEAFGALNLVRRNILHSFLAYFRDGEVLNLSGRTAGYRTKVLQREELYSKITNEYWRGQHLITTGDDNFLTSWVVRQGWKTRFVNQDDAVVSTSVNDDASYLQQLMRWSRDTARNYLQDLGFAIRTRRVSLLIHYVYKTVANYASDLAVVAEIGILLLITASRMGDTGKVVISHRSLPALRKLWRGHVVVVGSFQIFEHAPFFARLQNLIFVPGAVIYAYIHAAAVVWALLTLDKSVWGPTLDVDSLTSRERDGWSELSEHSSCAG